MSRSRSDFPWQNTIRVEGDLREAISALKAKTERGVLVGAHKLSTALEELGPAADKVQPIFITVDPERDTVEAMADYVGNFDPRIVGLTGTPEQIAQAAKAYRVYYKKVPQGDDYTMDHTGILYVMDPEGRFVTHFSPNTPPSDMADRLRKVIG